MSNDVKRPIWPGLHACYDGHGGISVYVDDRHLGYIRLSKGGRIGDETEFITGVNGIASVTAERDQLRHEVEENTGVIAVWRGRTLRAEAERDRLRAALESVAKVTSKYGGQMSDLFGHDEEFNDVFDTVNAVLAESRRNQPQPEN